MPVAAVLVEFGRPLELRTFAEPALGPGEVRVRVLAAGVCGSDVHMWQGRDPRTPRPLILGHEGVGEVAEIRGTKQTVDGESLQAGDRIIWNRGVSCGQCYHCVVVRAPSLCPHRWAYGIHRSCASPPYLTGCYAEQLILDAYTDVFKVDPALDPAVLVAASCSGATAAHAFELCPATVGGTVVLYGPGPLGLFSVALARAQGASQVVLIGGTERRLELGRQFGATLLLNRSRTSEQERLDTLRSLTAGRGADLVVEAAGSLESFKEALGQAMIGGRVAAVGFGEPVGSVALDAFADLARKNLHLQGVWVSDAAHTRQAVALVAASPDLFRHLVTHRFPLAEATAALEAVASREAVKAVLLP